MAARSKPHPKKKEIVILKLSKITSLETNEERR
jgi:hypothetical protein